MRPPVVGVSSDFFDAAGRSRFPEFDAEIALGGRGYEVRKLELGDTVPPGALAGLDGLVLLRPRINVASLAGADSLAVIARFGVGYDRIDTSACVDRGVAVTVTPFAVRRPVAVAALSFLLALTTQIFAKDALVRRGPKAWPERTQHNGRGLRGRTLGTIGFGGIGQEFVRICRPLGLKFLCSDPGADLEVAEELGVEPVALDALLARSDIVAINCPLTPQTAGLLGKRELALMRPGSFLINTSRGGIVDESALAEALQAGSLAGAGLDVFHEEPLPADSPLLSCPNIILSPHCLAWTDENFRGIADELLASLDAVLSGRVPKSLANPEVTVSPSWRRKLEDLAENASHVQA